MIGIEADQPWALNYPCPYPRVKRVSPVAVELLLADQLMTVIRAVLASGGTALGVAAAAEQVVNTFLARPSLPQDTHA